MTDDLSPEDRAVADRIAALPDEPLPEGAEERMLERFRRERGRTIRSLADVLEAIHDAGERLMAGDTRDYERLVRHLALAVLGSPAALLEATARAAADPVFGPLVIAAAQAYVRELETIERDQR